MGIFDTYDGAQLKCGDVCMQEYERGDKVDIPDGAYITYEGVVVVENGVLVGTFTEIFTKWGDKMDPVRILDSTNPIVAAMNAMKTEGDENK